VIQEFVILVLPALPMRPDVQALPSPRLLNGQFEHDVIMVWWIMEPFC